MNDVDSSMYHIEVRSPNAKWIVLEHQDSKMLMSIGAIAEPLGSIAR